jgi:hypothetical protein
MAHQCDHVHAWLATEYLDRVAEQLIAEVVIQSPAGRSSRNHDRPATPAETKRRQEIGIGCELAQVHLLLEAGVETRAPGARPLSTHPGASQGVGHQDRVREAKREMVRRLPLVIHRRHDRHAEHSCRDDLCI